MSLPSMNRIAVIFLIILNIKLTIQKSVKTHHIAVHEMINEQARIDKVRNGKGVTLPYGNPLVANAKAHAQNQQAMFNAEKIRQHRAQVQRWTKAPPQVDSYMKAFRESQENHHIALEQKHTPGDIIGMSTPPTVSPPRIRTIIKSREVKPRVIPNPEAIVKTRDTKTKINVPDVIKFTKADVKVEKNRNHRSHGSIDHHLSPKRYQTVYILPGTTYDEGVTIKPNGINTPVTGSEGSKLYTEAIPSTTQYIYPKQYGQMQSYLSAHEIESLGKLLKKEPEQQLEELKEMYHASQEASDGSHNGLEKPFDLYFYAKDNPVQSIAEQYDPSKFAQISTYYSAYQPEANKVREFTPITEEVDDIANPMSQDNVKALAFQPTLEQNVHNPVESTTIKSNNYYKVEVASQTISGYSPTYQSSVKLKPDTYEGAVKHEPDNFYGNTNEESSYAALHYPSAPEEINHVEAKPIKYIPETHEDYSQKYLHHNAQNVGGIHHLTSDGTGVSAYGDDEIHYASNYEFGYRVHDEHSGNVFGHAEEKNGEKTNGQYHVLLPDGRLQNVKYSAGPEGFHADVSYGQMQYQH